MSLTRTVLPSIDSEYIPVVFVFTLPHKVDLENASEWDLGLRVPNEPQLQEGHCTAETSLFNSGSGFSSSGEIKTSAMSP